MAHIPNVQEQQRVAAPVPDFNTNVSKGLVLKVMQGAEYGKCYNLNDYIQKDIYLVTDGRYSKHIQNNICIKDFNTSYISRRHFSLEYNPMQQSWYMRDGQFCDGKWENSLNGTYINSRELRGLEGVKLKAGDIISIGEVKLRVEGA